MKAQPRSMNTVCSSSAHQRSIGLAQGCSACVREPTAAGERGVPPLEGCGAACPDICSMSNKQCRAEGGQAPCLAAPGESPWRVDLPCAPSLDMQARDAGAGAERRGRQRRGGPGERSAVPPSGCARCHAPAAVCSIAAWPTAKRTPSHPHCCCRPPWLALTMSLKGSSAQPPVCRALCAPSARWLGQWR